MSAANQTLEEIRTARRVRVAARFEALQSEPVAFQPTPRLWAEGRANPPNDSQPAQRTTAERENRACTCCTRPLGPAWAAVMVRTTGAPYCLACYNLRLPGINARLREERGERTR